MAKGKSKYGQLRMPDESDPRPPQREASADSLVERIRAQRPEPPVGRTPAYGRRADPHYVQLNANVPAELKTQLKRYTLEQGVTISEVVEALLADYLAGKQ